MAESGEKRPPPPTPASGGGLVKKLPLALFVFFSALLHTQIQPPPAKIPGSPGGPPVTAPRTKLKDGRHLAYLKSGVPKEKAKYKVIFVHGFDCCRYDVLNVSQGLLQELGIYLLSFDRPGYGESDAHPARTEKSIALDIAELADNLQLGPKFHLIGFSMGGEIMWSCLKYIPHRLSGVAILAPVGNYWWSGLPPDVSREAWYVQFPQDRRAVWVAHHLPWLTYWWNTQRLFPSSSLKIICLINVSFKIIIKILAVRLGKIADRIIHKNQTVFIKNRNILDGVVSLHEILHELRVSKRKGVILKLDYEKAYDKIQWGFLESVM